MDWFSYLVAGIMVYLVVAIFIVGMAYQIFRWLRAPKTRIKTGVFPKPKSAAARWIRVGIDSFTFPQVVKVDRWAWIFTIPAAAFLAGLFYSLCGLIALN